MSLAVDDGSNSTSVTTSGDHAKIARFELDEVHNLVGVDVQAKGIVNLDGGIGVSDGPAVAGVQVRHVLRSGFNGTNAAKLILGLLVRDSVNGEPRSPKKRCVRRSLL